MLRTDPQQRFFTAQMIPLHDTVKTNVLRRCDGDHHAAQAVCAAFKKLRCIQHDHAAVFLTVCFNIFVNAPYYPGVSDLIQLFCIFRRRKRSFGKQPSVAAAVTVYYITSKLFCKSFQALRAFFYRFSCHQIGIDDIASHFFGCFCRCTLSCARLSCESDDLTFQARSPQILPL